MQDKIIKLKLLTKNKRFKLLINEPFNEKIIDFIIYFGGILRKKNNNKYKDLIYLFFWCSKKNILRIKNEFKSKNFTLGRGLAFHLSPSNVPTNFFYSFMFGILSGNSNIVKIPDFNFPETKIIMDSLDEVLNLKKYKDIKNSNHFLKIKSDDNKQIEDISLLCDCRLLWGGDKKINELRKMIVPERCVDITFPDRYSLSVININKFAKITNLQKNSLIKNFFYDSYMFNQRGCNSPHFIFWVGKVRKNIINTFWSDLNNFVKKNYILDEKLSYDKYANLIKNIINFPGQENIKFFKNFLYVIDLNKTFKNIEFLRGKSGTFYQINIKNIDSISNFITKKCQTVTYFGFEKDIFKRFMLKNNLLGIDRFVPIGKGTEIDVDWDGYNIISSLSRIVKIEDDKVR
jgi:hypothetical protein